MSVLGGVGLLLYSLVMLFEAWLWLRICQSFRNDVFVDLFLHQLNGY